MKARTAATVIGIVVFLSAVWMAASVVANEVPENDLCENAIAVAVPSLTAGSTLTATTDSEFPYCDTSITAPGVWYTVVGTGNEITADTCYTGTADYDSKISVYCPDCADPFCAGGNDDAPDCFAGGSTITWCSETGETYYILVHGFSSRTGNFELSVSDGGTCTNPVACAPPPVPENDECEDAITVDVPSLTPGSTLTATTDSEFPDCGPLITTPGVWYRTYGTGNEITADTCYTGTANYDSKISVYCPDCADPVCIGGNDDAPACFAGGSTFTWCSQAGASYYILVHGYGGATGNFELSLSDGAQCTGAIPCSRQHIIMDKVTVPSGDPQVFAFTTTGAGYAGFSLTDSDAPNDQGLDPGDYSVTEVLPTGWELTGLSCASDLGTSGIDTSSPPTATITLEEADTVTCTFTNTLVAERTGESTDSEGVGRDHYFTEETVYATGSGFPTNSDVRVHIVGDRAWTDGEPIGTDESGGWETVNTDGDGNLGPAVVWVPELTYGDYDLVFDVNQNDLYDAAIDVVDDPNHPGFVVRYNPVGGEVAPVDRVRLLAPYLGAVVLAMVAVVGWQRWKARVG
jgi:hypothetical protein